MTGRPGRQQERCALMPAGSAGFASKRRTHRRSRGEPRNYGTAGIARRREPGLSFIHSARMVPAYGKCRFLPVMRASIDLHGPTERVNDFDTAKACI